MSSAFFVLLTKAFVDGAHQLAQLGFILALDFGQSKYGSGLLVHDGSEASLALDDGVGHPHLAAKRGEENHQLDRVDVVRYQNQGSFLGFDESDNVVEAVFHGVGFLAKC